MINVDLFNFFKFRKKKYGFFKITENALKVIEEKAKNNTNKKFLIPNYDDIIIPTRKTIHSAGYDISLPTKLSIKPNETIYVCLGVEVRMPENCLLQLLSRSSNNTDVKLNNYLSVIDADYCNTIDEKSGEYIGAIYLPLKNYGNDTVTINKGTSLIQGVFLNYKTFDSEEVTEERNGGFGSTGK